MSGSIKSKKRHYNRKHKLEQEGLRVRHWADSTGKREVRLLIKRKNKNGTNKNKKDLSS